MSDQIPILWRASVPENSGRSIKNLTTTKVVTVRLLSFADSSPTSRQFAMFSEDGAFSAGGDRPRNPTSCDTSRSSGVNGFILDHFNFGANCFYDRLTSTESPEAIAWISIPESSSEK
jgi:hypothetical protein